MCEITHAYIVFKHERGHDIALEFTNKKENYDLILGKKPKFTQAKHPNNIIWENQGVKKTENNAASDLLNLNIDLADVDEKVESLTARYKKQFSAMESAVTSLKSTGDYLTNMMDAWNSDK